MDQQVKRSPKSGERSSLYRLGDAQPSIEPSAWIAPTAAVIGDVRIGAESGIWFHCVLRGDTNFIQIGRRTNIQDGTIVHVDPGEFATVIGDDVTIGHACIIHGCRLEDAAFVGMGATVMNGAVIEGGGVLGAGGLLTGGRRIAAGELWTGAPAKLRRMLTDEERAEFMSTAPHYARNAARFKGALAAL
jgi:carbonic anhydrase/acetyltransferase-like protein (isoleucine patch superfamily)